MVDWLSRVALPFGAPSGCDEGALAIDTRAAFADPEREPHLLGGRGGVFPRPRIGTVRPAFPLGLACRAGSRPIPGILLDLLDRHNTKGTFFVVGWVAERCPQLVRRIAAAGHEVGCHSHWHRQVFTLTPDEFREDLKQSKGALEQVLGQRIQGYRAPGFSIIPGCEWAFDILLEEGITYDSSLFPIVRPEYGYPNSPGDPYVIRRPAGSLLELPLTTTRIAGVPVPGRRRRLPAPVALRPHPPRLQRVSRAGRPGHVLRAPMGSRSRPAAPPRPAASRGCVTIAG